MNISRSMHQPGGHPALPRLLLRSQAGGQVPSQSQAVPITDESTRKVGEIPGAQAFHATRRNPPEQNPIQPADNAGAESSQAANDKSSHQAKQAQQAIQLLSEADRKQLEQLKARDREVRSHEAAHLAAAGRHATSGARYTYTRGADGRSYAVGGSVGIDTSAEATPEATLRKANQIKRAALAPAEPSGQDRAVASTAMAMAQQAHAELLKQKTQESKELREAGSEGQLAANRKKLLNAYSASGPALDARSHSGLNWTA